MLLTLGSSICFPEGLSTDWMRPTHIIEQGSLTSGPQTGTGRWPVRNQATQQEVSSRLVSEPSPVFIATLHCSRYHLSSGLPLTLHYSELFNLLTTYHNIIIIEINCTTHVMHLNHPQTTAFPPSVEKLSSMTSLWCRKR